MNVCYIFQDEYPWDIRVDKITDSLASHSIETHIICRNRSSLPEFETLKRNLYVHRLRKGFGKITRTILNFPAFFSPFWAIKICRVITKFNIELILVRDLPLSPLAWLIGNIKKIPVLIDMAENYPAMISDSWKYSGPHLIDYLIRNPKLLRIVERYIFKRLNGFLVVSEASKERVLKLVGPGIPVWVVGNTPRITCSLPQDSHPLISEFKDTSDFVILYTGGLEAARGLEIVISALPYVINTIKKALLVIVGKGASESILQKMVQEKKLEKHVLFGGWVDQKYIPTIIANADICLIPHYVTEHTDTTIPNKIYDYMAQKKPVIATNARSLKNIIETCKCGKTYTDKNPEELGKVIIDLKDNSVRKILGEAGYQWVHEKFNWTHDEKVLINAVLHFNGKGK